MLIARQQSQRAARRTPSRSTIFQRVSSQVGQGIVRSIVPEFARRREPGRYGRTRGAGRKRPVRRQFRCERSSPAFVPRRSFSFARASSWRTRSREIAEPVADLLQRHRLLAAEAEAQRHHLALLRREVLQRRLQQRRAAPRAAARPRPAAPSAAGSVSPSSRWSPSSADAGSLSDTSLPDTNCSACASAGRDVEVRGDLLRRRRVIQPGREVGQLAAEAAGRRRRASSAARTGAAGRTARA